MTTPHAPKHTITFTSPEIALLKSLVLRHQKQTQGSATSMETILFRKFDGISLVDYNHVGRESDAALTTEQKRVRRSENTRGARRLPGASS